MKPPRIVHDHCSHCRMSQAEPSRERIPELELFVERWAAEHGYRTQWPAERYGKRTTLRLTRGEPNAR
jgi:hypothetical protein